MVLSIVEDRVFIITCKIGSCIFIIIIFFSVARGRYFQAMKLGFCLVGGHLRNIASFTIINTQVLSHLVFDFNALFLALS